MINLFEKNLGQLFWMLYLAIFAVLSVFNFSGSLQIISVTVFISLLFRRHSLVPVGGALALHALWGRFYPDFLSTVPSGIFFLNFVFVVLIGMLLKGRAFFLQWCTRGQWDNVSIFFAVFLLFSASGSLIVWAAITENLRSGSLLLQGLKNVPSWYLVFLGLPIFSFASAVSEEFFYRGLVPDSLPLQNRNFYLPLLFFHSIFFACLRLSVGFPSGVLGFLILIFWGVGLGHLRFMSGGIGLGVLTRFGVDYLVGLIFLLLAA